MKIHLNYRHVHMTSSKAKVLNRLCISEPWTQGWNQDFDLITDAVTQCIMLVISAGYMQLSFEIKASKAGSIKFRIFHTTFWISGAEGKCDLICYYKTEVWKPTPGISTSSAWPFSSSHPDLHPDFHLFAPWLIALFFQVSQKVVGADVTH